MVCGTPEFQIDLALPRVRAARLSVRKAIVWCPLPVKNGVQGDDAGGILLAGKVNSTLLLASRLTE